MSNTGAAGGIAVAIADPVLIAASSDGSAGSNGNLANFSAICDQNTFNGETPSDYYGSLIFSVGNDVSNGSTEQQASQLVLQQLQDQRGAASPACRWTKKPEIWSSTSAFTTRRPAWWTP